MLDSALAALEAAEPTDLSDVDVVARAAALQGRLCRLQGLLTRDVAAIHARGAATSDGFASTQALLRRRLRLDARTASRHVTVASGLAGLPHTQAALRAGEISLDHAAAICQAGSDLGAEVLAGGAEKLLLDEARLEAPGHVWRLAAILRERMTPDEEEQRQAKRHAARWLAVDRTFHGQVAVEGVVDPVTGELLLTALQTCRLADEDRTPAQRRVDALADICRAALGATTTPLTGEQRPHVTVTTTLDTLRQTAGHDPAHLGPAGTPICAQTARRLACDAGIIPAVLGTNSEPLDIGRHSRLIPTGIRRALTLRDTGCRFPGCDRPAPRTDAHHLHHWANGGPTSVHNLVLLCAFHHWLVHEGQWTIHYQPHSNALTAARPDGSPYDIVSQPRGQPP